MYRFFRFSTLINPIFQNKPPHPNLKRFQTFHALCDQMLNQLNSRVIKQDSLDQIKKLDLEEENLIGIEWLQQHHQNQIFINKTFTQMLYSQVKMVHHLLINQQQDEESCATFCKALHKFHYFIQPTKGLTVYIFKMLFEIKKQFPKLDTDNLLQVNIGKLIETVNTQSDPQVVLLFYQLSVLNLVSINIQQYFQIFNKIINKLTPILGQLSNMHKKSFYYTLGKHGIYNQEVEDALINEMKKFESAANIEELGVNINLLLCSSSFLYIPEYHEIFRQFIDKIFKSIQALPTQGLQTQIVQFYIVLQRCQLNNEEYWNYFINNYKSYESQHQLNMVLSNLCIFKDEYTQPIQDIITKLFTNNFNEYIAKIQQKRPIEKHRLEGVVFQQLKTLNIQHIQNYQYQGIEIDVYFPDKNLALEIMGPMHFSFKISKEGDGEPFFMETELLYMKHKYSQASEHKLRRIKKFGMNVKMLDFFELRKTNIQSTLLDL